MRRRLELIGLLLLASGVLADSITTIELQNRPAEEVIRIIQPMLGPGDAISGQGFRIFLRSSPETLALVSELVDVLDTAAKTLQVSVFQGSERELGELVLSANIQIESGDVSVDIGEGRDNDAAAGGSVTYSTTDGRASINANSTQGSLRDDPIHQVRVTEGTEAYIATGSQIPYFLGGAAVGRRVVAGGVEYKDAMTGFYVLPRLRGDNVVLEVSAFKNSQSNAGNADNRTIDTQSATTIITGRVGEWLPIGGVSERIERAESATGTTIATRSGDDTGIWIKADLVE